MAFGSGGICAGTLLLTRAAVQTALLRGAGNQRHIRKKEFLEHAREAQQHADLVAARIVELNGKPDFDPESWRC